MSDSKEKPLNGLATPRKPNEGTPQNPPDKKEEKK